MVEKDPKATAVALPKTKKAPALITLPSGAKILHTKCKQVKEITPEVKELAQVLEDYLKAHQLDDYRPIGISAPQLGKALRMFSCTIDTTYNMFTIINPELVYERKLHLVQESCLSLPGKRYMLKRGKIVKIRGTLIDGTRRSFKAHDLNAQMFMHELNHLDGITIDTIGQRIT